MIRQKHVLAVTIAERSAIAFRNENIIVSEMLPTGKATTPEVFAARLSDAWKALPISAIYLTEHVGYQPRYQLALEQKLREFAAEHSVRVVEIPARFYRNAFTGNRLSLAIDVYDEAVRLGRGPRSVSEAEAMALLHFAVGGVPQPARAA